MVTHTHTHTVGFKMAKKKPKYPKMTDEAFNSAVSLTRMGDKAIFAARSMLIDGMETEEAGLAAGYPLNTARSAASRAALTVTNAANICPCCKQTIKRKPKQPK